MRIAAAVILCLLGSPTFAEEPATPATPTPVAPRFNEMFCSQPSGLNDLSFEDEEIRINNVSLGEGVVPPSQVPVLRLTASAVNKTDGRAIVSIEVAGLFGEKLGYMISTQPLFGEVPAFSTRQLDSQVVFTPGESKKTTAVCIRASKAIQ